MLSLERVRQAQQLGEQLSPTCELAKHTVHVALGMSPDLTLE